MVATNPVLETADFNPDLDKGFEDKEEIALEVTAETSAKLENTAEMFAMETAMVELTGGVKAAETTATKVH